MHCISIMSYTPTLLCKNQQNIELYNEYFIRLVMHISVSDLVSVIDLKIHLSSNQRLEMKHSQHTYRPWCLQMTVGFYRLKGKDLYSLQAVVDDTRWKESSITHCFVQTLPYWHDCHNHNQILCGFKCLKICVYSYYFGFTYHTCIMKQIMC